MRTIAVLLLALASGGATPALAHDRAALQREVASAAAARDWCRALHYTELLETLGHEPRLVFNAAELARAAGDLVTARRYYQELVDRDPGSAKAPLARQGIEEVGAQLQAGDAGAGSGGARCATPAPRCGDGAVEGNEVCDDGNTESGDGCVADCSRAPRCGDNVLDANEMCDDGNLIAGDNCSALCLPEAAGTPRLPPQVEHAEQGPLDVVRHEFRDPTSPASPGRAPGGSGGAGRPGGSNVVAMGLIGASVVAATTGVVCSVIGPLSLASYFVQASIIDGSAADARGAPDAEHYAVAVGLTGAFDHDMRTAMEEWNGSGRLITAAGVSLLLIGAGGIVGGALLFNGAPADEAVRAPVEVAP